MTKQSRPFARPSPIANGRVAVVALLLVLGCAASRAAAAADKASAFGEHAVSFAGKTMPDLQQDISVTHSPLVLIVYDDSDTVTVDNVWKKVITGVSDALHPFTAKTAHMGSSTTAGRAVLDGFGIFTPAILLFDGILRPVPHQTGTLAKMPIAYGGELSVSRVTRWVLESISGDLITRIDTDADLTRLFSKYPGYPELPRVLYFSRNGYVSPVVRVLSQIFQSDAVFGSVVAPFEDDDDAGSKAEIAKRYGIESKDDLPAFVVLRPSQSQSGVDNVVRVDGVAEDSVTVDLSAALEAELPDSAVSAYRHYAATGEGSRLNMAQKRKLYILSELGRERAEVFGEDANGMGGGDSATAAELAKLAEPVVVTTQSEWQRYCAQMRDGSHCFAVVADPSELDSAKDVLRATAARILKSVSAGRAELISFVIIDADRSGSIRQFLDVGSNGVPDAVLLTATSPRLFYNFIGSFSSDNLVRFYLSKTQVKTPTGGTRYLAHLVPGLADPPGYNDDDDKDL